METAALLVMLAVVGGVVVVRSVYGDERRAARQSAAEAGAASGRDRVPGETPAARRPRRLLTAAALTDALALEGDEEGRPSFLARTLAFGRLLLVILFICALAGGTLFWVAMMIASKAHIHPS